MMRKNSAFVFFSVIVAATIFGVLVFSVSAAEDETIKEDTILTFRGFRNSWLDTLTDDQLAKLEKMVMENRAEMEENRNEIMTLLEAWGVEIPVWQGPRGWYEDLTDEQREELETMKQDYQNALKAKLDGWGVEVPELDRVHGFRMGFCRRGPKGFNLFKP